MPPPEKTLVRAAGQNELHTCAGLAPLALRLAGAVGRIGVRVGTRGWRRRGGAPRRAEEEIEQALGGGGRGRDGGHHGRDQGEENPAGGTPKSAGAKGEHGRPPNSRAVPKAHGVADSTRPAGKSC